MSSVVTGAGSNLFIFIRINDVLFTSNSLLKFDINVKLNEAPSGEFVIIDRNSDLLDATSGNYGQFYYSNTSDGPTDKASGLTFVIDEMSQLQNTTGNTAYTVKWSAGNKLALRKSTRAFNGSSLEALIDVCEYHKYAAVEQLTSTDYETPADSMTWRYIQDDMWEALNTVVNRSYMKGDYIYWAFDDVNNVIKASTFNFEKSLEDKHLFIYSDNSNTDTTEVKSVITEPSATIWSYNEKTYANDLGKNRNKLFPNVSFTGIVDAELEEAEFRRNSFSEVLKSMGDESYDKVQAYTGINGETDVFGDLKLRRHWPNNIHKMYSFADIYRDYKLATYGKVVFLKVYNTVGPPIGSKCAVLAYGNDRVIRGINLDLTYTDNYILVQKFTRYSSAISTTTARTKSSGTAETYTILKFVSDNYGTEGFNDLEPFIKSLEISDG